MEQLGNITQELWIFIRVGLSQLEQLMVELSRNPVIAFALFLMIGVLAPLVEELFKPMALWFLLKRPLKDSEGFSLGLISGGALPCSKAAGLVSQIAPGNLGAGGRSACRHWPSAYWLKRFGGIRPGFLLEPEALWPRVSLPVRRGRAARRLELACAGKQLFSHQYACCQPDRIPAYAHEYSSCRGNGFDFYYGAAHRSAHQQEAPPIP